jgi:hypothetical protein
MTTTEKVLELTYIEDGDEDKIHYCFLMVACIAYDAAHYESDISRTKCDGIVKELISAAHAGGYTNSDILHTMLVNGKVSPRVVRMAATACKCAGNLACIRMMEKAMEAIKYSNLPPEGATHD